MSAALVSGEGVPLHLERAGPGSRTVAALIDLAAQFAAFIALIFLDVAVVADSDNAAATALILLEYVAVLAAYPILFEWLSRGRTLGKLAMGLRVVREDGGPIGFRHALVRGLSGFLLEKPGIFLPPLCTSAGVLTMIFNRDSKRIGDLMAGTFVVNERGGSRAALLAPAVGVPYQLQGWAAGLDLTRVDDRLALDIRQFLQRVGGFTPSAQYHLGEALRGRLNTVLEPALPPELPTPVVLPVILAERRRRAEPARYATTPSPTFGATPFGAPPFGAPPFGATPFGAPPTPPAPTTSSGGFSLPS